ncbi:MAG: 4Fe-4S dicluster domain-containing protein [Candidatus Zixiibacteriota bacterium]|nr:MAG: 4Fe-4S dicluster domain-containing protein [candidate division Zixibacteria bacterium]
MKTYGLLVDFTACIGCKACMETCKEVNRLPGGLSDELNAENYSVVKQQGDLYYRQMCMHCLTPSCVSVCPVGALEKTSAGPVNYDGSKCMGCRYCMVACPFNVPRYEWDKAAPVVRKCIMCIDRLAEGKEPACAWVCPMGATRFGERDRLLEIAHARIKKYPDRYVDHVYGEHEVGGTSVLMLSSVPFADLGFRSGLPHEALPELTWTVLRKIPNIVFTTGIILGGVWWVINRRMELDRENHKSDSE